MISKACIALCALVVVCSVSAAPRPGSVAFDAATNKYSFRAVLDKNAVAFGTFDDTLNTTGQFPMCIVTFLAVFMFFKALFANFPF